MRTRRGWFGAGVILALAMPAWGAESSEPPTNGAWTRNRIATLVFAIEGEARQATGIDAADPRDESVWVEPEDSTPAPEHAADPRDGAIFGEPTSRTPASEAATDERDEAIFGEPEAKTPAAGQATSPAMAPSGDRDSQVLGGSDADGQEGPAGSAAHLEERLLDLGTDRLQIGGLMLMRLNWSLTIGDIDDHAVSMPNLVDVYLDARPNDRLRAFVRGRLLWDPTVSEDSGRDMLNQAKVTELQLNELWMKFDIARRVFVTLGQKLVLMGTTRFWNPVDVINQQRRPVFNLFDQRNGTPMVKLHVPVESLGWNFYAIGLVDEMDSLDKAGLFGRAEFVVSTVELGLIGAYRESYDPVIGADLSAGLWNFDVTGEITVKFGDQFEFDDRFDDHLVVRTTAGLAYNIAVFDEDIFIIGTEYFYNQDGSEDTDILGLLTGTAQYFYTGRHYGAVYATLPAPGRLDDWTFMVSGVGNFSDHSFIARFDTSVRILRHLNLQVFIIGHFGNHGELRLGADALSEEEKRIAEELLGIDDLNAVFPTQVIDIGFWLSLAL